MGEILGIGATHYPPLCAADEHMLSAFRSIVAAPLSGALYKDRKNWPPEMLAEMGDDEGLSSTKRYRARMYEDFRKVRKVIDDFKPDFIVIFGDDQYENFAEDIIPPFCVYGLDDNFVSEPWSHGFLSKIPNAWGEPNDWKLNIHGHREGAKYLTTGLLKQGVCMPYAYKTLHQPTLAHAFTNTILYLDCDRRGFPHPVVPFHVNCYGSAVIKSAGGFRHLYQEIREEGLPDPPGPSPQLCMEVGSKVAQVLQESPWRVVLMASSSWSHCFLSPTNGYVVPDRVADRYLYEALQRADYAAWRNYSLAQVEQAGEHEMLNWFTLVGAMDHLKRKPVIYDYVETYIFQSEKCFCSFPATA